VALAKTNKITPLDVGVKRKIFSYDHYIQGWAEQTLKFPKIDKLIALWISPGRFLHC
jgi:hypothetical protein